MMNEEKIRAWIDEGMLQGNEEDETMCLFTCSQKGKAVGSGRLR